MLKKDIMVGGLYFAKVAGRVTTVRVDTIRRVTRYRRSNYSGLSEHKEGVVYDVTNLNTGRTTVFKSAAKFRSAAPVPTYAEKESK